MKNLGTIVVMALALFCVAGLALAEDSPGAATPPATEETAPAETAAAEPESTALIFFGGAFSSGLIIVGAAYGIGKIGSSAVENMARQPEVAGNIQTAMIIAAALIEGATFFGLIVCLLVEVL